MSIWVPATNPAGRHRSAISRRGPAAPARSRLAALHPRRRERRGSAAAAAAAGPRCGSEPTRTRRRPRAVRLVRGRTSAGPAPARRVRGANPLRARRRAARANEGPAVAARARRLTAGARPRRRDHQAPNDPRHRDRREQQGGKGGTLDRTAPRPTRRRWNRASLPTGPGRRPAAASAHRTGSAAARRDGEGAPISATPSERDRGSPRPDQRQQDRPHPDREQERDRDQQQDRHDQRGCGIRQPSAAALGTTGEPDTT